MIIMNRTTKHVMMALLLAAGQVHAEEALRPDVGKPLQAAQDLMKAGKYKDALAKVREAEAAGNRTPDENYYIDRMRGSAAAGAGDEGTAIRSFEAVLSSGRLQTSERLQTLEALAGSSYRAKDYAKAVESSQRYFKEGGSGTQMRSLQVSAQYLSGDFAGVVRSMQERVQAAEQAVPLIDEPTLRLLAASQIKLGDEAGYANTLEKLLVHHPKQEYWADLLSRIQNKPGFADRLGLDILRLQMATHTMGEPAQYVEMAQLALQAGLPAEASRVIETGYAAGKLGAGADAERHKRLRDVATKQAAEDEKALSTDVIGRSADALVNTGQALVTTGRIDKGIELMEQGLSKGGLKRPEDARLHLAQAYLLSGNKAKAVETLKSVHGGDGTADLARLWVILARQS
jgi:tetratricopeptide (TPR) repeat protein